MVAYTEPKRKKEESERLKEEGNQIKFVGLGFERWHVVGLQVFWSTHRYKIHSLNLVSMIIPFHYLTNVRQKDFQCNKIMFLLFSAASKFYTYLYMYYTYIYIILIYIYILILYLYIKINSHEHFHTLTACCHDGTAGCCCTPEQFCF